MADVLAGINRMLAAGHLEETKRGALKLTAAGRAALDQAADEWEAERCVYCGALCGPDGFEDGLRCKLCAEEADDGQQDAAAGA